MSDIVYLYVTDNCTPGWSVDPPRGTDSLGHPEVNLVEGELDTSGMVSITKCLVPKLGFARLTAADFLYVFAPERVREACMTASKERVLSLLRPGTSMSEEALQKVLEGCGYHFGNDAIRALTREGELSVGVNDMGFMQVTRHSTPMVAQCVTPNGRTDCHMSYIQPATGHQRGASVCAFCLKDS